MVTQVLVDKDVALGKDVFDLISRDPILRPSAAMWIFDEDAIEWRYLIATEFAATRGPQAAYSRVQSILRRAKLLDVFPFHRCVVVAPNNQLVSTMANAISNTGGGQVICNNSMFNDIRVTAHIYFLRPQSIPSAATRKRNRKTQHN
jgi:hypothetical protein